MSGGELMVYGKLLLTFGGLLGFGAWQLWQLRRLRRQRCRRAAEGVAQRY